MGQGGCSDRFSCYPGRAYSSSELQIIAGKDWTRAEMPSPSILADLSSEASTSGNAAYLEHTVTRLDTLAGVAIKYGVEVADVKRFNGLSTDLQMFALKTLRIPTPGRHPPSTPTQFKGENFVVTSGLHRAGGRNSKLSSDGKLKAAEKTQDASKIGLLRDYHGLPSTGEDVELTTISSSYEIDFDDDGFLPMCRPPNTADFRRFPNGEYKPNRCGYVRESCNELLNSCWSAQSSQLTQCIRLLKSENNPIREGDSSSKENPIRRRARGELGSDDVSERINFPKKDLAPRLRDSDTRSSAPAPILDWHTSSEVPSGIKTIRAALLGGKGAVEGLLSKVMTTAILTTTQEGSRPFSERVPSTGSFSMLEGITSVYRQAKAALDSVNIL